MSKFVQFYHPTGKVYVRIDKVTGACSTMRHSKTPYKKSEIVNWEDITHLIFPPEDDAPQESLLM